MKIVIGLFDPQDTIAVVRRLNEHGFSYDDFSLLSSTSDLPDVLEGEQEKAAASGAAIGATAGGTIGALGAMVASTVTGLGPVFVSGLIATSAGAIISGFLGSLYSVRAESQTKMDIRQGLSAGKMLLIVKTKEEDAETVKSLLAESQGEHIEIHAVPEE